MGDCKLTIVTSFLLMLFFPTVFGYDNSPPSLRGNFSFCQQCSHNQSTFTAAKLKEFCTSRSLLGHEQSSINGRCCVSGAMVLGMDLSDCGHKGIYDLLTGHKGDLEWLALNGNDHLDLETNDFSGLKNLTSLYISPNSSCPGSSFLWKKTHLYKEEGVKLCFGQLDTCSVLNITCPSNSYCVSDGPGFNLCLCDAGWHSYRCLRFGKFPAAEWLGGITGGFLGVIVLLRIAQTRSIAKLKRKMEDEGQRDYPDEVRS